MKQYYFLFFLSILSFGAFAQPCTPNTTFTSPGLYPDTMPEGTVGQAYSADVTFVMPTDTSGFDFTNFQIVSIQLPAGLTWQCDNFANGCNYNPQVNIYGCVHVSGTPLLAGDYTVTASFVADLTITSGVVSTLDMFLRINPQSINTSNNGFSITSNSNCAPVQVNFTNNNPGLMAYSWDFGNGNTSTAENPPAQIYSTPGTYIVNYEAYTNTAPTDIYTLTNFSVNSMTNGSYGGLVENADAYFKVFENGTQVFLSSTISDTDPPVSWTTNLVMNNGSTYTVEVWESDAGEFGFGADDYIGVANLSFNGCTNCALDANGTISYTVNHVVIPATPSVVSADTIIVYDYPATPLVSYDNGTQILSTTSTEPNLQWYFNGVLISGATNTTFTPTESGYYSMVAIGPGGCAAYSDSTLVVICDPNENPVVSTLGTTGLTVTNPNSYAISWTLNGNVIAGQTTTVTTITSAGVYQAILTDSFGCQYPSNTYTSTLSIAANEQYSVRMYPNPTSNILTLDPSSDLESLITVTDMLGRTVYAETIKGKTSIALGAFGTGVYLVKVSQNGRYTFNRVVVH
ncbi:MAG: T9SS type A sorting domain-containing protein [Fluviicola sp.]|nr:T9SS type A sorting domain-containing protein [Fluviicola sp.]